MSLKNMGYDHPAYMTRQTFDGIMVAGSGGVSAKFIAHAALLLFALHVYATIAGTSTYTSTVNGTTTVNVASTQLSLIRITNTAAALAAPALSTTTVGPFTVGPGGLTAAGTATNAVGVYTNFALNTSTGTAGFGGLAVNKGDQLFVVNGTDATAVELVKIEYQLQPLADVTA